MDHHMRDSSEAARTIRAPSATCQGDRERSVWYRDRRKWYQDTLNWRERTGRVEGCAASTASFQPPTPTNSARKPANSDCGIALASIAECGVVAGSWYQAGISSHRLATTRATEDRSCSGYVAHPACPPRPT